jgi:hypothetical protein
VNSKRLVTLVAIVVLVGTALVGAGWKWGHCPSDAAGHQQLAGWSWDSAAVAADEGGNG